MNSWQELTVEVLRDAEEAASNILIELGSQGVAIDDSADYLGHVGKYGEVFPEIKQVEIVKITAYYPENVDIEAVEKEVADRLAELILALMLVMFTTQRKNWQSKIGQRTGKNIMNQRVSAMI